MRNWGERIRRYRSSPVLINEFDYFSNDYLFESIFLWDSHFWLETSFIGDESDGDSFAFGCLPRNAAVGCRSSLFANLLLFSGLWSLNTISGFVSELKKEYFKGRMIWEWNEELKKKTKKITRKNSCHPLSDRIPNWGSGLGCCRLGERMKRWPPKRRKVRQRTSSNHRF